jgi:tetratricopeptide (TPR) repeat protein
MATAHYSVGATYAYGFGRLDKASPWFEKAVSLDPGDPTSMALLAELSWDLRNEPEAKRWLSRALTIGDEAAFPNAVAALMYLDSKDLELARKHAQVAAEVEPYFLFLVRDHDISRGEYAVARARYSETYPQLFAKQLPKFNDYEANAAIDLALVLQRTGEEEQAKALLDRSAAYIRTIPRMGPLGYAFSDVRIHALRGEKTQALVALREAQRAGCNYVWRYVRDHDPALASIRNEPEFKSIFSDIERDMAKQRAALAARPKDAPLEIAETGT